MSKHDGDMSKHKKYLVPYFTLGDPSIDVTEALVNASFDAGADMIELGIPFSDPVADGPVIQASHQKAINKDPHIGIDKGFKLVASVKKRHQKPLIFMLAANIVYAYGLDAFFKGAKAAGLDACLIPDVCIEDASDYVKSAKKYGVGMVFLVSPLTDSSRLKTIIKGSSPFVYLISSTGTTGEKERYASNLEDCVTAIKAIKDIPVLIGFGVSSESQVAYTSKIADGAIIGSSFVKTISESKDASEAVALIASKIKSFKKTQVKN